MNFSQPNKKTTEQKNGPKKEKAENEFRRICRE